MGRVRLLPLTIVLAAEPLTEIAAQLKSGYRLPDADCFAAAVTGKNNILVTTDVKDFKNVTWLKLLPLLQYKS